MFNLFAALNKEKVWGFSGGIHPPEMKSQTSAVPLRAAPLPHQLIIPLQQHLGPEGELRVKAGDRVLRGQPLTIGRGRTLPVHAPTSGTISAIRRHMTAHPSGLQELCVLLEADGEDRWCERRPVADYRQLTAAQLLERIHLAGIAGLGGAGFPTAAKLQGGLSGIETLIINAAECEPYITADDRLMQEHAQEVLDGSRILAHLLQPARVIIGIEDNKPQAIEALRLALRDSSDMVLRVIPTKYPSGGAKQLTKILTGKEVPFGKHSASIGVLMQNVGTAYAIKRAIIDGEPLTERVVTLTGEALRHPGNVWARLGTPVQHLLQLAGLRAAPEQMVIMGGPLMGFTLPALQVPIVKISNCILAPSAEEIGPAPQEEACIRCSRCADACPAGLLPQQLYWFSRGEEHEKARQHHLFDCIECGACAYVCPSNIPLVQYYRQEKAEIRALDAENTRAAEAKMRFEAKQSRLEREKLARKQRHEQAAVNVSHSDRDKVQAALARVRDRQFIAEPPLITGISVRTQPADNGAAIAARAARKEQARLHQAERTQRGDVTQDDDPRRAALAAAIARAKAKKAAQSASVAKPAALPASESGEPEDPRKAAVAAAIARVKARQAEQSQRMSPEE